MADTFKLPSSSCGRMTCLNIWTTFQDINDSPPNPNQAISNSSLAPRAKPWETIQPPNNSSFASQSPFTSEGSSSVIQGTGFSYQLSNIEASAPGWQQNVRITEIENDTSSNGTGPVDRPPQRKWVPPQPPPIAMPEAAVAIQQPKSAAPTDQPVSAKSPPHGNEVDDLLRITRISESGGQAEMNGGGSEFSSSEILEEAVAN